MANRRSVGDDGRVTAQLDWYGCSTFRLKVAGLTIFLDAYIDRTADAAGTGLTAADIDECDWIVVGHSHFDHLWGAERILANTSAKLIASYESIRVMEAAGVPLDRMICVGGGETVDLGHGVTVAVYPSQHSCVWSHQQMGQPDEVCLGELGLTWQERNERMKQLSSHFASLGDDAVNHLAQGSVGHSTRGDGGALVFVFDTPEGSLLFQDTSGYWSGILGQLRPDVAIIAAAGRGNINGEPVQGTLADFVAEQVGMLSPRRVFLAHHDNWLPGFSIVTDTSSIRAALAAVAADVELVETGYLAATDVFGV
jgi:L-ascorbate metabolism protein UlaG (beta-lactamase superfamily)